MRLLFFFFVFLSSFCLTAKTIRFKFRMLSKTDSSIIHLSQVKLTPVVSYYVKESESHSNTSAPMNFNAHRMYYDPISKTNIFEYDSEHYSYHEAFLQVQSDSFFYFRQFDHDYDEPDCFRFRVKQKEEVITFFLHPLTFFNIFRPADQKQDDCFNVYMATIEGTDTTLLGHPAYVKKVGDAKPTEALIRTIAVPNTGNHLIFIEVFNQGGYKYIYYPLHFTKATIQSIYLDKLSLDYWKADFNKMDCVRFSAFQQRNNEIEYYPIKGY